MLVVNISENFLLLLVCFLFGISWHVADRCPSLLCSVKLTIAKQTNNKKIHLTSQVIFDLNKKQTEEIDFIL